MHPPQPPLGFGRTPAALAFFLAVIFFLIGALVLKPFFPAVDDALLNLISRGIGVTQQPSEFLFFINVSLGLALKQLNLWLPNVPWYALLLETVLFLATWAFGTVVLDRLRARESLTVAGLVCLPSLVHNFAWPQYTATAFWAAQAGILLLVFSDSRPRARWAGGVLVVLAGLLRWEAAVIALGISIPFGWFGSKGLGSRKAKYAAFAAVCGFLLTAHIFDEAYYASRPEWRTARDYARVHNHWAEYKMPAYDRYESLFRSFGWSPADFGMYLGWYWLDPKFDLSNLQKIDRAVGYDWPQKLAHWEIQWAGRAFFPFLQGLALVLLLWNGRRRWKFLVPNALWFVLVAGGLVLFAKTPEHVLLPQLFYLNFLTVVLTYQDPSPSTEKGPGAPGARRFSKFLLLSCLAATATLMVRQDLLKNLSRRQAEKLFANSLERLHGGPGRLWVLWNTNFPLEAISAFDGDSAYRKLRLIHLGWAQRAPWTSQAMADFGVHSLLKDMVGRKDVFLIFNPGMEYYRPFLRENHGLNVKAELYYAGFLFDAYRIVPARRPPA